MDKTKLFLVVIIVGCAFIIFGGVRYLSNLEEKFDSSKSDMTIFGRNDLGNMLNLTIENQKREKNRSSAIVFLFIGAVVTAVGFAIKPKQVSKLENDDKQITE